VVGVGVGGRGDGGAGGGDGVGPGVYRPSRRLPRHARLVSRPAHPRGDGELYKRGRSTIEA
jgi:hypothetical protein